MLLVVMHHCGGSLDHGMEILTMNDVPLFFLCSGFLAYKKSVNYLSEFYKKARGLLIPFVLALLFVAVVRHKNPIFIFTNDITKSGYWFFEALFLMFVMWWGISVISHNKNITLISFSCITEIALLAAAKISPEQIDNIFCFSSLCRFFPCFLIGCFIRKFEIEKLTNRYIGLCLLIISIIGYSGWIKFPTLSFLICVCAYASSAILLFFLIKSFEQSIPHMIHKQLCMIGTYSLNIYIIHFFIVPHLVTFHSFIINISVSLFISVIVTYASILISRFLTFSTPLNKVLR